MEDEEEEDTFLFEFEVVYQGHDHVKEVYKIKFFLSTLKDSIMKWFMSLKGDSINTCKAMKQAFLDKYHEYCRTIDHNKLTKIS
jgi:hypothetical protein